VTFRSTFTGISAPPRPARRRSRAAPLAAPPRVATMHTRAARLQAGGADRSPALSRRAAAAISSKAEGREPDARTACRQSAKLRSQPAKSGSRSACGGGASTAKPVSFLGIRGRQALDMLGAELPPEGLIVVGIACLRQRPARDHPSRPRWTLPEPTRCNTTTFRRHLKRPCRH